MQPQTRTEDTVNIYHGVPIHDPYRWLENSETPETRKWIEAQDNLKNNFLLSVPERPAIRKRLEELMRVRRIDSIQYLHEEISPVFSDGKRYFYSLLLPDKDLSVICMREGLYGKETILLDPNQSHPDRKFSFQIKAVSKKDNFLIYGIREGGEDEQVLRILEIDSRRELKDAFPKRNYSIESLLPGAQSFYYSILTDAGPRVFLHKTGTDTREDEEIFGKGFGPENWIRALISPNNEWLLFFVYESINIRTLYLKDLRKNGEVIPFAENMDGSLTGDVIGNDLYLLTTFHAPNGMIVRANLNHPSPENWQVLVPETNEVIKDFSLVDKKVFVTYMKNAMSHVKIFDQSGKHLNLSLQLPGPGTINKIWGEWESEPVFFSFESFIHPETIFLCHPSSGKQEIWFEQEIGVKTGDIEVRQIWYESKDKTRVPLFLVHKKGIELDGNHPTLLTGYGGFNISMTPDFDGGLGPLSYVFAEMGGVYALANIRGGGEFGEKWHQSAILERKQNSFDDFISAAEWLVRNGYTRPEKLAIAGGSNGGLLVGASLTQRPDLFKAVICSVPLLDMLRHHKFFPAQQWVAEYGSSDDPEQFEYLLKYSPYHNIVDRTPYPSVLFITGDADTRVHPLHARKMTAKLQAASSSGNPILLSHNTLSGHIPAGSLERKIEALLDRLCFLQKLIFS